MLHGHYCNHSYRANANHSFCHPCNAGYMDTLSKRISDLRRAAGMSQADLARAVGVSRVAVTKWESGETANLKLCNLLALCRVFRTNAQRLIDLSADYEDSNTIDAKSVVQCKEDHGMYNAARISSQPRIFSPAQEQAFYSLTDEGRALVRAQVEISIKTAVQIHGTRSKQTAA